MVAAQEPDLVVTRHLVESRWYLRANEVAALAGLAPSTVREAIYAGRLPARKFRGRGWLIATEDARAWIERESEPATAA